MEEKLEAKTKYKADNSFGDRINLFFSDMGLAPLQVPIAILENSEYSHFIDRHSMASMHFNDNDSKATSLRNETEHDRNKLYLRELDGAIDLSAAIQGFLQAYLPNYEKAKIDSATDVFVSAFRCYDKLYSEKALRDFFVWLCKQDSNLFKLAQLKSNSQTTTIPTINST